MTSVFVVHGCEHEDQQIRGIYSTYADALAALSVPIVGASEDVTISEWEISGERVQRPRDRGVELRAWKRPSASWDGQHSVSPCDFDAEDADRASSVRYTRYPEGFDALYVWGRTREIAEDLFQQVIDAENARIAST